MSDHIITRQAFCETEVSLGIPRTVQLAWGLPRLSVTANLPEWSPRGNFSSTFNPTLDPAAHFQTCLSRSYNYAWKPTFSVEDKPPT